MVNSTTWISNPRLTNIVFSIEIVWNKYVQNTCTVAAWLQPQKGLVVAFITELIKYQGKSLEDARKRKRSKNETEKSGSDQK